MAGDLVQEREDGEERGRDGGRLDVALDDGIGHVLERERRERPTQILEQVEPGQRQQPPRTRPPATAENRTEAAQEVAHGAAPPNRSAWRWNNSE